jgi:hypothetical protein
MRLRSVDDQLVVVADICEPTAARWENINVIVYAPPNRQQNSSDGTHFFAALKQDSTVKL